MNEAPGTKSNETLDEIKSEEPININTDSDSESTKEVTINHKLLIKDDTEDTTEGSGNINPRKRKIYDDETASKDHIKYEKEDDGFTILSEDQEKDSINGPYGLSLKYLKSLNITPPLSQWIMVTNFRCDKSELRDVLEMAGQVLICSILTKHARQAKAMYSHPLEAVQAVSMLNRQVFYGQSLNVSMIPNLNHIVILPKGLHNVGPGLGRFGRPIRNIAEFFKSEDLKQFELDPILFQYHSDDSTDAAKKENAACLVATNRVKVILVDEETEQCQSNKRMIQTNSVFHKLSSDYGSTSIPQQSFGTLPTLTPSTPMISQLPPPVAVSPKPSHTEVCPKNPLLPLPLPKPNMNTGLVGVSVVPPGPSSGPPPLPPGPPPSGSPGMPQVPYKPPNVPQYSTNPPMMTNPNMTSRYRLSLPSSESMSTPVSAYTESPPAGVTLHFRNLPPTTTFGLLSEKVAMCGQVLSLRLTTPGCAVATFVMRSDAERCYRLFHGKCIDGHVVETFLAVSNTFQTSY